VYSFGKSLHSYRSRGEFGGTPDHRGGQECNGRRKKIRGGQEPRGSRGKRLTFPKTRNTLGSHSVSAAVFGKRENPTDPAFLGWEKVTPRWPHTANSWKIKLCQTKETVTVSTTVAQGRAMGAAGGRWVFVLANPSQGGHASSELRASRSAIVWARQGAPICKPKVDWDKFSKDFILPSGRL